MISYVAEDNEDTEPTIERTYQDDLIPVQGELLWENYLANQFTSNLPILMPNHTMANHIKSHIHSFSY
jgi:hypothetical protein